MTSPLADIEFLARSKGRAEVLATLRTAPRTRSELRTDVDATRTTVGRALDDLEDRRWLAWRGDRYELTALGAYIAEGFADLVREVEAARELHEAIHWLVGAPPRFDPGPFAEATLVTTAERDDAEPVDRFVEDLAAAERPWLLLSSRGAAALTPRWQDTTPPGEIDIVTDVETISELVEDHDGISRLVEAITAGRVRLHRHRDEVPHTAAIADEAVSLFVFDTRGTPRAAVRTTNQVARGAGEELVEAYREQSSLVSPDRFAGPGDGP